MTLGQLDNRCLLGQDTRTHSSSAKCNERLCRELELAQSRGRLTVGAAAAAEALARSGGGGVGLCVLAGGDGRGLAHLQVVLIEAFCREAGVPVLRVEAENRIATLLGAPVVLVHSDVPLDPRHLVLPPHPSSPP